MMFRKFGLTDNIRGNAMWPPCEQLLDVWNRLRTDSTYNSVFAELVLPPLIEELAGRNRNVDRHLVESAAADAVLAILSAHDKYDPTKLPLKRYLLMSAQGDLKNLLAKEWRHHRNRSDESGVEHRAASWNQEQPEPSPLDSRAARQVIEQFDPRDRAVYELLLTGERRTQAYARVLGLEGQSREAQAAEVKRAKDRVKARLKRAIGGRPCMTP